MTRFHFQVKSSCNQTQDETKLAQAFPSRCDHSITGQQVMAEIIQRTILLLTVRDVCNKGQECNKWGRGQGPFHFQAKRPALFAKDMPDAQGPY